jgi:hypothetical protein
MHNPKINGFTISAKSQNGTPWLATILFTCYKKLKIEQSPKRTMATVFWNSESLLLCEFFPPKTRVNSYRCRKTL